MGFIDFIDNKQDFITNKDLLELFHIDKLLIGTDKIDSLKSKILLLTKFPVNMNKSLDEKPLEDVVLYKENHYYDNEWLFLVDKATKTIVIDIYDLIYLISKNLLLDIKFDDLSKCIVNNLGDYKIINLNDILPDITQLLRDKNDELIRDNFDTISKIGKNELEDDFMDYLENTVKTNYILDKEVNHNHIDFFMDGEKNIFKNIEYQNLWYLIILYLRNKNEILDLMDVEFNRLISENEHWTKVTCRKIYHNDLEEKLTANLKSFMKDSIYLNMYKEIIKALSLAGKTVNINGKRYENTKHTNCNYQVFKVGRYGDYINFSDIVSISYGKKVLFNRDKFIEEFKFNK